MLRCTGGCSSSIQNTTIKVRSYKDDQQEAVVLTVLFTLQLKLMRSFSSHVG